MYLVAADGQCWVVVQSPLTLGRAAGNTIVVNHPTVSRHHARIEPRDTGIVIVDLHSANGTFVNDERVLGMHHLQPGDRVRIGTTIVFGCEASGIAVPPAFPPALLAALESTPDTQAPTSPLVAPATPACPACGAPVRANAHFCPACGHHISAS